MLGIGHLSRLFNQSQRYSLYDLLTSVFVVFYTNGQNHLNVQVVRELNKGRKKGRLRSLMMAFSADRAEPTR
ncbi:hypothetical protein EXX76_22660 [Escherichia coli]|nr:hypothetical protein [Escherichia coli]EFE1260011.1 hypothetical protein [Escherichia coli]EFO4094601.1 hypothetical protein [Escherichia coli]KAB3153510.1 hypothetical protein F9054_24570 [Escherichia coli]RZW37417.1 hypothetical protein EXX76_22660 [Escherichia coli]